MSTSATGSTTAPDLVFTEETHTYRVRGKVVPSVTQILQAAGMMPWLDAVPPDALRRACARGTRVHNSAEKINRGDPTWADDLTNEDAPYINGYFAWLDDTGFKVDRRSIEKQFFNQTWGYAGRIDFEGNDQKQRRLLVDIKSGGFDPAARLQTAAYLHRKDDIPAGKRRLVLQLRKDGTYRAHPLPIKESLTDWQGFKTCLSLWNLKQLHGINPRRNDRGGIQNHRDTRRGNLHPGDGYQDAGRQPDPGVLHP